MPLPESVRVKLSSEAAEFVALTPVVVRDIPMGELLEQIAGAIGLDAARARDILKRGTLVSGASRFRWDGWECALDDVAAALSALPKDEPSRLFDEARCVRATLTGRATRIEIGREAAQQTRLFQRRSFWNVLMEAAQAPAYVQYLYRDRADLYRAELSAESRDRLRAEAGLLKFDSITKQIQRAPLERLDLVVTRA